MSISSLQLFRYTSAHTFTLLHCNCLYVSVSPFDWKFPKGRGSIIFILYPQSRAPCSVHGRTLINDQMMAPVCAPTPCPPTLIPAGCHIREVYCAKVEWYLLWHKFYRTIGFLAGGDLRAVWPNPLSQRWETWGPSGWSDSSGPLLMTDPELEKDPCPETLSLAPF